MGGITVGLYIADADFNVEYAIVVVAGAGGTYSLETRSAFGTNVIASGLTTPPAAAIVFDSVSGLAYVRYNGISWHSVAYSGFSGQLYLDGNEFASSNALDSGKTVSLRAATCAADFTVSHESGVTDTAGNLISTACTFPLDLDEATVITTGFAGRLDLSNGDQTGERVITDASGSWAAINSTGRTVPANAGVHTVQMNVNQLDPITDSGSYYYSVGLAFYNAASSLVYYVICQAGPDGDYGVSRSTGGALNVLVSSPSAPGKIGVTFDADNSEIILKADGVIIDVVSYSPEVLGPVLQVDQNTVEPADVGNVVRATFVTDAASIDQGIAGSSDVCGNLITTVASTYPLDDDGTVAASFGAGFAAATAPGYQTISYGLGTEGVLGGYAATAAADPFGTRLIDAGTDIVGFLWEGLSLEGAIADYDTGDFSSSIAILASNGTIQTTLQLIITDASGNIRVSPTGAGAGTPSDPDIFPSVPWVGLKVGMYVNGATGQVGWVLNGVDQGYLTGPSVGSQFSIALTTENAPEMHPILDNRTVSHRLVTSGLGPGFPVGTLDVGGNPL